MLTPDEIDAIVAREKAATPAPLDVGIYQESDDPVGKFKEHLSYGTGDVWLVWCPEHPKTRGEYPRPEHAVVACITGNGPTSKANAEFFAHSKQDIPRLLADREELKLEASVWRRLARFGIEESDDDRYVKALYEIEDLAKAGDFAAASKLLDEAGYKE